MPESAVTPDMTREERVEIVLEFMTRHKLALPTKVIFRNLKIKHRFTVGKESVRNYLNDLVDRGHLTRIDPNEMESMEVIELPRSEGRGYYMVTQDGIEAADLD